MFQEEEEVRRRPEGGSSEINVSEVKGSAGVKSLLKVRTSTSSTDQEK